MSSVTRPRGPLSARVYWTRRLVALALALALVFGIRYLLSGGPQPSPTSSARPAAAQSRTPETMPSPSDLPAGPKDKGRKVATPLALPTGPCEDSDVRVTPSVDGTAYAGRDVTITLHLSTVESPACTWEVSADSVVLKLTSGTDRIWTTQDCPEAVAGQTVVVRKEHTSQVDLTWSGRRSDNGCTRSTLWVQPGYYHVSAAAYGAEPEDYQFQLLRPVARTITPKPKGKPSPERDQT